MAWIKMRRELVDHPKVKTIARRLGIPVPHVNGCLHAVWSFADVHADDERIDFSGPDDVDEQAGVEGFAEAMREVGWLDWDETGLEFIDYEQHNGTTAKQRAQASKRVKRHRERSKPQPVARAPRRTAPRSQSSGGNGGGGGGGAAVAEPPEQDEADDDPAPHLVNPTQWPQDDVGRIFAAYPKKGQLGRVRANRAIGEALTRIQAEHRLDLRGAVAHLLKRVQAFAQSPKGRSDYVQKVANWMDDGGYDDPPEAWQRSGDDKPPPQVSPAYQKREPTQAQRDVDKRMAEVRKRKQQQKGT